MKFGPLSATREHQSRAGRSPASPEDCQQRPSLTDGSEAVPGWKRYASLAIPFSLTPAAFTPPSPPHLEQGAEAMGAAVAPERFGQLA